MSYSIKLHDTMDAEAWSGAFLDTIKDYPDIPTDKGAMLGWFANAIMAGSDGAERKAISPSEAIFGFSSWLTTRGEAVTIGANHECGCLLALVTEYCRANELAPPREGWTDKLKCPSES